MHRLLLLVGYIFVFGCNDNRDVQSVSARLSALPHFEIVDAFGTFSDGVVATIDSRAGTVEIESSSIEQFENVGNLRLIRIDDHQFFEISCSSKKELVWAPSVELSQILSGNPGLQNLETVEDLFNSYKLFRNTAFEIPECPAFRFSEKTLNWKSVICRSEGDQINVDVAQKMPSCFLDRAEILANVDVLAFE